MPIRLAAPLLLITATFGSAQAIQVPPAQEPSATIHQTVNNVLVDVVVTDKNGQPLRGLSKDRFQVLENGVPQQIAFFEEHQTEPTPPPFPRLQLPANVYTNISSAAPDNGPILVLLMDALNTPLTDQVHVRAAMLSYLRTIPSARHIAIFTLTGKLRMVQGFNGDPATLIAALDQVANWQKQSHLTDDRGTDSYADTNPKILGGSNAADVLSSFVANEQAWRIDQRVGITLDALDTLATYLSALPGRKNLVWFSGSFPLGIGPDSPMPAGFDANTFVPENLGRGRDLDGALRQTSDLLKLARVAVYPVAAGGLPTPSMFATTRDNNDNLHNSSAALNSMNAESTADLANYATMDTLAEATGGRSFHSTNDLAGAIASVHTLASSYYTIAYSPKIKKYDDKYRKLVVKVDAPKAKVDYRRGYYAEDPSKLPPNALAQPTHITAALLHGAPAAADILFKVRVAPTEKAQAPAPGVIRYSVNWSIDLRSLNLQESSNGAHRGDLGLAVVAYNSDSKAINSVSTPASLILEPDEYRLYLKSGLQFHQEIDLPVGHVSLRVAIVNTTNNRAGATEIPLTIQPLTATANPTPAAPH